jgi:hypothetical protein
LEEDVTDGLALGAVEVLYDAARAALYGLPYFLQSYLVSVLRPSIGERVDLPHRAG